MNMGNAALTNGELIELFVIGTAVVPTGKGEGVGKTHLVLSANDRQRRCPGRRANDSSAQRTDRH